MGRERKERWGFCWVGLVQYEVVGFGWGAVGAVGRKMGFKRVNKSDKSVFHSI